MFTRRQALGILTATGALLGCATSQAQPKTYVLIHGGWLGSWVWDEIRPLLEKEGARVFAPTLKGLAERKAENGPNVTLTVHIDEVVDLIKGHQLRNVILVGHSYAGFVVTGVCDRIPERIGHVVYLDAFVPQSGQNLYDFIQPPARTQQMRREVLEKGEGFKSFPPPAAIWGLTGELLNEVNQKMTPHPAMTYEERLELRRGGPYAISKRTYIDCQKPAMLPFVELKSRLRLDSRWRVLTLQAGHLVMLTHPELLASSLADLGQH